MNREILTRYYFGFATIIIAGMMAFFIEQYIEDKLLQEIEKSLVSLVSTTRTAVISLADQKRQTITLAANQVEVRRSAKLLIQAQLISESASQQQFRKIIDQKLQPFRSAHAYADYFILNRAHEILATSSKAKITFDHFKEQQPQFFKYMWKLDSMLSLPFRSTSLSPGYSISDSSYSSYVLEAAPIRDEDGGVIAVLIFSSFSDSDFQPVFSRARIGDTGETFGVGSSGLILTNSRFNAELIRSGLLEKGQTTTLRLSLDKDSAVLSEHSANDSHIKSNLKGYLDYRGRQVVGVWQWDSKIGLFFISKIDKTQAYSSIYQFRAITTISFIAFSFFIAFSIFFLNKYTKINEAQKKDLEESESRLRQIFENIPSGNLLIDAKGLVVQFSKSAEKIFGHKSAEIMGKNISLLLPDSEYFETSDFEAFFKSSDGMLISNEGVNTMAFHKDGHSFPILLSIGVTEINNIQHVIASITDRTTLVKIEKKLLDSQKMEALGHLASGIAHDFNNLLAITIGNVELLEREVKLSKKGASYMAAALKALDRSTKLTRQILSFSRKEIAVATTVDLNASIREVSELIEQTASRQIDVSYVLAEQIGAVKVNLSQLGDVLINLAANARDAMPGGGRLTIETSVCSSDEFFEKFHFVGKGAEYILLSVNDTGVGIAKADLENIFEPFFTTKTRDKGTGLGLAMVYSFVKDCDGEIQVESEEGVGTTITIFLPVSLAEIAKSAPSAEKPVAGGSETILIVDDEAGLLEVARTVLENAGYTVLSASNGKVALDIVKNNKSIDLLLSDVIMPGGINGFELAHKSTLINPKLKTTITSGFTDKAKEVLVEGDLFAKTLSDNLLPKPYNHSQLLHYVRYHLDEKIL